MGPGYAGVQGIKNNGPFLAASGSRVQGKGGPHALVQGIYPDLELR